MPLTTQSAEAVKTMLDGVTKEGPTGVNGLVFVAMDKDGKTLIEHASGTRSVNSKEPMDMDTSFCEYKNNPGLKVSRLITVHQGLHLAPKSSPQLQFYNLSRKAAYPLMMLILSKVSHRKSLRRRYTLTE